MHGQSLTIDQPTGKDGKSQDKKLREFVMHLLSMLRLYHVFCCHPFIMNGHELEGQQQMFFWCWNFSSSFKWAHVGRAALSYVLSRFEASADFEPETFGPAAASSRATADSINFAFYNTCLFLPTGV